MAEATELTVDQLVKESHSTAKEKGWWDGDGERNVGELLALIHSEVSEALEEYRDGRGITEVYYRESDGKPEGFPVELADVLIRIGDFCGAFGIDLAAVLQEKLEFNKGRPSRHGNKRA
jgi:NTP pyrophosphatase (non-canonical NTP hydrolase)